MEYDVQINRLRAAEVQFRLASAVHLATVDQRQPLELPIAWTHGQHEVGYNEIALTQKGAEFAASLLQRSAMFLMAVEIKEALTAFALKDVRTHPNAEIGSAFEICRLIRNGFAHNPMSPVWEIDQYCRNSVYSIEGIIILNTAALEGKTFEWQDFGGPLALLRLSEHVRVKILGDDGSFGSTRDKESVPVPSIRHLQQGGLILKALDQNDA